MILDHVGAEAEKPLNRCENQFSMKIMIAFASKALSLITGFRGKHHENRIGRFDQRRTGENHGFRKSRRVLR